MRPHLIDILELMEKKIPPGTRDKGKIVYSLDEAALRSNLEIIYRTATSRLSQLAYFVDASLELGRLEGFKPSMDSIASNDFQISFNNYGHMPQNIARSFNQQMGAWVCNVVMRELCEYLHYHLLQIYETCLTIKLAGQDILADQIEDIRRNSNSFERRNLIERFQDLHKEFEILSGFRHELATIYNVRHVFAHFDGYVQKKFCKEKDFLIIKWPRNKYHLVKRSNGKTIAYHKAPRPIEGDLYSGFRIAYFARSIEKKYFVGEQINLSPQDIQDLIYLFIHVFDQTHEGLVKFALKSNLQVRAFESYRQSTSLMMQETPPSAAAA